ncbi:MAG TPA: DUF4388 domain-containing protein [Myxococcaceae bacterium]|nr:DUF4388 domain-containing protein [Myxococcaceae bacterium]
MTTVLLADEHPPTLEHLRGVLSQGGYDVIAVGEPQDALERFATDHPLVAVVSVALPKVDGKPLPKLLRGLQGGEHLPILAMDRGHQGKAGGIVSVMGLEVNAYVPDPMKSGELLEKLRQLVEGARKRLESLGGLAAQLARPPEAGGDLRSLPLPAYLFGLYREAQDGVLVVASHDLTRRVYLRGGAPVSYDSTARQDTLAAWLVDRGRIRADEAEAVMVARAQGLRIGAALAEAGVNLEGEELLGVLREYTREKVAQVLGMRGGRWSFYPGDAFLSERATVEVAPLGVILEGARRAVPLRTFMQVLKPHLPTFPYRTGSFPRELPALELSTSDLKIAMQANGRVQLRELLAHGRGHLTETASLFWLLAMSGAVAFSEEPEGHQAESLPPKKPKPLPPEIAQTLREEAVGIITGSYFRVLGLTIAAGSDEVEAAYREIAPRFHPDTWIEFDISDIADLLDSVQEKLTASYKVLSNEPKRRAYLQYLLSRLDVERSAGVHADAEIALKRGESALKRGDITQARVSFEQAVELNPREPEYYSFLAWATYLSEGQAPAVRAQSALRVLKKALSLNPYLERAQVIHAIIESEQGAHTQARRRLLDVLEMNPQSAIAKAALRRVGR